MPEGNAAAVIGSPPYEGSEGTPSLGSVNKDDWGHEGRDIASRRGLTASYGETAGQLGQTAGDTFWSAAAEIVAQCRMILRPGGHAIWVCKDFVRDKKRVPFSDQWQALCEAQGFKLVCRHKALLVAHHGEQDDAFGGTKTLTTERKSFFRRLAERKGSPRIDHEDVICLIR